MSKLCPFFFDDGDVAQVSILRMLRILKIMKMLRFFRLLRLLRQGFKELRLILNSLLGCGKVAIWSMLVIASATFLFGLCIISGCANYLRDKGGAVPRSVQEAIGTHWGSIGVAMLSLYQATTGGNDWINLAGCLKEVEGGIYFVIFVCYIAVYHVILINALGSLFVEATLEHSKKDIDHAVDVTLEEHEAYEGYVEAWFSEVDQDDNGSISAAEIINFLHNPRMLAFAQTLGLELNDIDKFFGLISKEGDTMVDRETFIQGCCRVKGAARSLDLFEVKTVSERTNVVAVENAERLSKLEGHCQEQLGMIRSDLATVLRELAK